MEKILELKIYNGGGVESTPFPNSDNPIEIGAFRYDAKRMGGAPTITASVNYPTCLDDEWTDKVYALFNGEKYFLKQTPTSSYDNTDVMYKHDIELVSERAVLDNVYFFDVVTGDPMDSDKPVSNSTKVVFVGDVREFARRMNASLEYSNLLKWEDGVDEEGNPIKVANGYNIVVDNDEAITTDKKLMSFEDQFFSNVLQEIYNTYEVPYYFDGKTIHIGFAKQDVVIPDLSYGVDNALLSVTKNNANYKTVNRATGYGSTDNIPYYYPNNSPKGDVVVETSREDLEVIIADYERFCDNVGANKEIKFYGYSNYVGDVSYETPNNIKKEYTYGELIITEAREIRFITNVESDGKSILHYTPTFTISQLIEEGKGEDGWDEGSALHDTSKIVAKKSIELVYGKNSVVWYKDFYSNDEPCDIEIPYEGNFKVVTTFYWNHPFSSNFKHSKFFIYLKHDASFESSYGWYYDDKRVNLNSLGLVVSESTDLEIGDTIIQRLKKYVKTSQNLMPSVYRQSDAKERFYNAVNYPFLAEDGYELKYGEYLKKEDEEGNTTEVDYVHNDAYKDNEGEYIHFDHPYVEGKAKEHIVAVEDLKPTIKDTVNAMGLRMDMFSEFAYDDDDNDETIENEEGSDRDYVHSYFFGKLRKLDFNLFDCAIEQQPMTISFTSGVCGACNFEIGATEEFPQKNPVQVDSEGNLVRRNGRVVCGQFEPIYENELQPEQQDTINNEVWIALKKEDQAYGELMPKAPVDGVGGHRPKAARNEDGTPNNEGDTFVILGIHLPDSYIDNAERKLEKDIIKYIKDNNEEKFTFSIGFSRIYFAENENILKNLSENSKVRIFYNNLPYDLYVSSFSYNLNAGDVLPDIKIELDETLKISQNPIQKAISQVKSQLGNALRNIDVVGAGTPYFLRKDVDDEVIGRVNFRKGVKFGEGGKVEVLDNNSAKLTIEYLEVTKKASFTSLEIQEKTHVGGQILVTPAAINCGEVEEIDNAYRCYFQTKGKDGDEIFNQFALGDQAICQTFNTWGSRYYWRKVVGVGEDYIDLSNVEGEYDEDSDAPMAGDKIIQLGNQSDTTRQNAIVIAAYGDGSPYIIQYKGINAFEIGDDKIVTKLSSTENIFTGKVHMELGSEGLDQLPEWIEVKDKAEEALEKAGSISEEAFAELEQYIDDVRQELQEQIDGAVDSYFEDYEPSTSNYPAKDWTSEEKESHLNDTFTNLADGRSWRWSKAAGVYTWVEIADTATSEALKIAGQAKESADRKIRMFVEQPYTPYSIGDLWSRGEEAPLMRCIKDKESGSFSEDDWDLADNSQSYTDEAISNIKIGGANLLRNSGFTGDYLSEQLADENVLEAASQLYSSPLDHWQDAGDVNVLDSTHTTSGKEVELDGILSQNLFYKTELGANYVLSFIAKGEGSLIWTLGTQRKTIELGAEWAKYESTIEATSSSVIFAIEGQGDVVVGDLKLEKGNVATSWSASPLDNASDRAYYQSLKYLQNAFEGATEINGGLVLTEQIKVGDYDKETKKWVKESGGMSGTYEDDTDVAFWAGGNLEKAITAVSKYENDPTYQPTEEELAIMAKFVVTHGGRAILEDAIVRGTIYARDGRFTGTVNATSGVFNNVDVQSGKIANFDINGDSLGIQEEVGGNGMSLYDKYISFYDKETREKQRTLLARIGAYEGVDAYDHVAEFENESTNVLDTMGGVGYGIISNVSGYTNSYAFASKKGVFAGFRPHVAILGSSNDSPLELGKYHHTVLALYGGTIVLDGTPENGQEYEIICPNTSVAWGQVQIITYDGKDNIYLMYDGDKRNGFSVHDLGGTRQVVKLVYFDKDKTWFCWHHIY